MRNHEEEKRMIIYRYFLGLVITTLLLTILSGCSISPEREALFATVSSTEVTDSGSTAVETKKNADIAATISSVMTVEPAGQEGVALPTDPSESATATVPTGVENSESDPRVPQLQSYLDNLSKTSQFMGTVLIAEGGEILLNNGYGSADIETKRSNTPQTQLRIGSLTKQFTAAAILRLQDLGRVNVDDPVSNYLPDYPGGEQITIHQLLTHTAGVPNYTRRPDLAQAVQTPITTEDLLAQFAGQSLDFPPGQQFAYSDSGYVILTTIIEKVSGQTYKDFMQTQFFEVLDMSQSGYDFLGDDLEEPAVGYQLTPGGPQQAVDTESSWASGAGALYSTTQDLYRWDRALSSAQLLEEVSLDSMFTPWVKMGQGFSYGYGWEIGQLAGRPSQSHAGNIFGFGSFMARYPEDDATIIVLGNGLQMSPRLIAEDLAVILFGAGAS